MLIDDYAPDYDVATRHHTDVRAAPEVVYAAVRELDVSQSWFIRTVFRLRGLPGDALNLEGVLKMGFVILDETPQQELLLGLIGRFWTRDGDLQHVEPAAFKSFGASGFAKTAWTFFLDPQPDGIVRVITETRVTCTDEAALRRFRPYWRVISPFSGLVRKAILREIKRQAESG